MKQAKYCYRFPYYRHTTVGFCKSIGDAISADETLLEFGMRVRHLGSAEWFYIREDMSSRRSHWRKTKSWKARCKKRHQWEKHAISEYEVYWCGISYKKTRKEVISRIGAYNVLTRLDIRSLAEHECIDRMKREGELEICNSCCGFLRLEDYVSQVFVILKNKAA